MKKTFKQMKSWKFMYVLDLFFYFPVCSAPGCLNVVGVCGLPTDNCFRADYVLPSNSKTPLSAEYTLWWDRDETCRIIMMFFAFIAFSEMNTLNGRVEAVVTPTTASFLQISSKTLVNV